MKHIVLIFWLALLFYISKPMAAEWKVVSEMPLPVSGAVAFTHDSLIYIFGGHSSRDFITPAVIQIYDPLQNIWRIDTLGNIQSSRYGATGGVWQGTAYFLGGQTDSITTDMDVLSLQQDSQLAFSNRNDNFNRYFAASQIYQGKLYCFGGYSLNSADISRAQLPYIFIYDLASAMLEKEIKSDFSNDLPYYQMTARIDKKIYILGGTYNGVLNTITYFDTETNTLQRFGQKMLKARYGGTAHALGDTAIMLIGGWDGRDRVLNDIEIISIKNHNQTQVSTSEMIHLNQARAEHVSVKFGDAIYVFGGRNTIMDSDVSEVEKYDFGAITTIDKRHDIQNFFKLYDNYPNPFNPSTAISYRLSKAGRVSLKVYDISGRLLKTIVNKMQPSGTYKVIFNASSLPSGVYFYSLNNRQTKRMTLIK